MNETISTIFVRFVDTNNEQIMRKNLLIKIMYTFEMGVRFIYIIEISSKNSAKVGDIGGRRREEDKVVKRGGKK